MKTINKQPKIRFKGYTDEWQQRKLGEIGKTQSGVGFPNTEQGGTEGIPFFKVSDMNNEGNENEMITANNYVSKEQIERKKWKPIEDVPAVIFAKVGAAIMLNRKRIVRALFLLDNNTMAYIFDNSWDADFGKTMFETINLPKYAQVGALPSYNSSDIENINIVIPNIEEQQKIGSFFKQLDDTIALHQRQLEALEKTKKSFLQKMFPKKDETKPEIRFAGFTDDWEERKLGEISKYLNGGSYENDVVENGTYELITLKSVNMSGKLVSSGKFINRETKTLEKDTLVMILSEQAPGLLGMTAQIPENNKYVLNQRVAEIKPNTNIDSYFLSMSINRSQVYFSKRGAGTKVQNISKPNVENFAFYCPSEREQQKIGSFFKQLDNTIDLHQRQLEALEMTKKSFLQKMFI
ncbi:restriction endonuclease subunit S [Vagococcus sp.]|uniref:restriction endonuclease subunit S n=1 Tax=Vagococcus sp. TaxID=1933889 RepID=UPI000EDFF720|nr:restriction endonuclease subunit S [Vagococcus sp.]HCT96370.1 restriction endonuclease subunit S [Vagococcus sp.]